MQINSLIECIENGDDMLKFSAYLRGFKCPEIGIIYTCSGIGPDNSGKDIIVWLLELKQYNEYNGKEFGYPVEWFREVQPPMTIPEELFNHTPETNEA